jgi:hypothetical protein
LSKLFNGRVNWKRTLVEQAKKVKQAHNSGEQEAVDDNNFLKSPNSGGAQMTYNEGQQYIFGQNKT